MPNPLQQLLNQRQQRQSQGIMGGIEPVKMANGGLVPSGGLPYGSPRGALGGYGGMGLGTGMGYAEGGEATEEEIKLFGEEGILFDPSDPWDWLLAVPGAGALGLGAKALLKSPKLIKAARKVAKTAGEPGKKMLPGKTRLEAPGKKLSKSQIAKLQAADLERALVQRGKDRILGRTLTGKVARGAGVVGLAGQMIPDEEETLAVSEAPQDLGDVVGDTVPETSTFWEKAKAFPQDFWKRMQTDENFRRQAMAGFVNMGKFTEGYVPRSGLTDFTEGMVTEAARQEGEMSEAEKTIGLIRSMGADMTDKDILSLVLGVPTGDSNRDRLKAAIGSTDPNAYDRVLVQIKEEIYRNVDPEYTAQDYAIVTRGEEGAIELVPDSKLVNIILAEGTDVLKNKSFTVMKRKEYKKLKKT